VVVLEACNKGVFKGVSLAEDGLKVNISKSLKVNISKNRLIGIGVSNFDIEHVAESLSCDWDRLHFMYLGLPVKKNMRTCGGWNEVVDRLNVRLSAWNAKNLSIGWRFTLVKAVLETNALWRIVIKCFYGDEGGFGSPTVLAGCKGVWSDIVKAVSSIKTLVSAFKNSFQLKVKTTSVQNSLLSGGQTQVEFVGSAKVYQGCPGLEESLELVGFRDEHGSRTSGTGTGTDGSENRNFEKSKNREPNQIDFIGSSSGSGSGSLGLTG
ncbi:hypothetical protein Tco_1340861, partial [Tanacetum coccineum]